MSSAAIGIMAGSAAMLGALARVLLLRVEARRRGVEARLVVPAELVDAEEGRLDVLRRVAVVFRRAELAARRVRVVARLAVVVARLRVADARELVPRAA